MDDVMRSDSNCPNCASLRRSAETMGKRLEYSRSLNSDIIAAAASLALWIRSSAERPLPGSDADVAIKRISNIIRGRGESVNPRKIVP